MVGGMIATWRDMCDGQLRAEEQRILGSEDQGPYRALRARGLLAVATEHAQHAGVQKEWRRRAAGAGSYAATPGTSHQMQQERLALHLAQRKAHQLAQVQQEQAQQQELQQAQA